MYHNFYMNVESNKQFAIMIVVVLSDVEILAK